MGPTGPTGIPNIISSLQHAGSAAMKLRAKERKNAKSNYACVGFGLV